MGRSLDLIPGPEMSICHFWGMWPEKQNKAKQHINHAEPCPSPLSEESLWPRHTLKLRYPTIQSSMAFSGFLSPCDIALLLSCYFVTVSDEGQGPCGEKDIPDHRLAGPWSGEAWRFKVRFNAHLSGLV